MKRKAGQHESARAPRRDRLGKCPPATPLSSASSYRRSDLCVWSPFLISPRPRPGVSQFAGTAPSALDLFQQQKRGGVYLGDVGSRLDFLVIFADRGKVANDETLERMRIAPDSLTMAHIPPVANGLQARRRFSAPSRRKTRSRRSCSSRGPTCSWKTPASPRSWRPSWARCSGSRSTTVWRSSCRLGHLKAQPHEQYALKRDQVYGSQAWVRTRRGPCARPVHHRRWNYLLAFLGISRHFHS